MIAATTGYNDLVVTFGVYADEETARMRLGALGCVNTKHGMQTTERFRDWLEAHGFHAYSCGISFEEGLPIRFIPCELNEIYTGYDDD